MTLQKKSTTPYLLIHIIKMMTIWISGERTTVFTLDSVGFQGRQRGMASAIPLGA